MSRLTPTQRRAFIEAQEALQNREIVFLRGSQNGRTLLANELQEVIATERDGRTMLRQRRHDEDRDIEFVTPIFGRSDNVNHTFFMRQFVSRYRTAHAWGSFQLQLAFLGKLLELADDGVVPCLVIDNAELLPRRAFTLLKWLNEIRDNRKRRNVGFSILMAGNLANVPLEFVKHSTELSIGRVSREEIAQLIEAHHPGKSLVFDEKALTRIGQLPKTLDMMRAVNKSLQLARRDRHETITASMVEETLVPNLSKAA